MRFLALIFQYLKRNWIIYSLVAIYSVLLLLRAIGIGSWLPPCFISEVTGHSCFSCGLNTAAIYLIRMDFKEAMATNPLIYLYVPLIIGWISYDFYKFKTKQRPTTT